MHPTQTQYFLFPIWIIAAGVVLWLTIVVAVIVAIVAVASRGRDDER